jgi:hypothetical protein
MANVYLEARPKGRPHGDPITDYVVEDHADSVLGTFPTQEKAIARARSRGINHWWLASGISTTKEIRIIGAQRDPCRLGG